MFPLSSDLVAYSSHVVETIDMSQDVANVAMSVSMSLRLDCLKVSLTMPRRRQLEQLQSPVPAKLINSLHTLLAAW